MRKKIIVRGPVLTQSGYGEQARFALRCLRSREDLFDIHVYPVSWGNTGWILDDSEEIRWINHCIAKTVGYAQQGGQYDLSLQVTIPNEWERLAPINIGYTAGIETTKVAPVWLQKANEMDKIIVVSDHAKQVFESTSYEGQDEHTGQLVRLECQTPIDVVNYCVRHFEPAEATFNFKHDFNYLLMAQWGPRKNLLNSIKWWLEENWDEPVGLVVKTSINRNNIKDRAETEERIKKIVETFGLDEEDRQCSVTLLHGDMSSEELETLYQHPKIKVMLSATHGEGFGLPLFEAASRGIPVIAPGWSGQCDFLYMKNEKGKFKPMFADVNYDIQPIQKEAVWNGVVQEDSMWCFPHEGSYKMRIRQLRKNYDKWKKKAAKLQEWITEEFTAEKKYAAFVDGVYSPSKEELEWLEELGKIEIL